jgi:hypothetical protein
MGISFRVEMGSHVELLCRGSAIREVSIEGGSIDREAPIEIVSIEGAIEM